MSRKLKNESELSLNGLFGQISMFKWFLIIVSKEFVSVGEVSVLLQNTLDTLLPGDSCSAVGVM